MSFSGRVQNRFVRGAVVCFGLLIAFYIVLVGTAWGHRLDDAAFLGREALHRRVITFDAALLNRVTSVTVVGAAGILLIVSFIRRSGWAGLLAVLGFGATLAGAEILKKAFPWQALAPADAQLGEDLQCGSYPSGHATIAIAFSMGLLLVSSPRWRPWLASVAGVLSSIFAAGVLFAGWHRGSDALGALAWCGICMNLTAAVAVRFKGRCTAIGRNHLLPRSVGFGFLVAAALCLISATTAPHYPYGDLPFFVLSGLIIAGSFSLTAWYAWQLRDVEFTNELASPGAS